MVPVLKDSQESTETEATPVPFMIPESLETPRLKLRMFQLDDWQPLSKMFAREDFVRYTLKDPQTEWASWRILASYVGHWQLRSFGPYAVEEKSSGKLVGPVGLYYPGDWPGLEIMWSIAPEFWGKGYASEAAAKVKQAAIEAGVERLISLIDPENARSIALAKRLGAVYEKTIPFRDGVADVYLHSLA
jgi:RimJ/RimL family protein N-acetyltransferase